MHREESGMVICYTPVLGVFLKYYLIGSSSYIYEGGFAVPIL